MPPPKEGFTYEVGAARSESEDDTSSSSAGAVRESKSDLEMEPLSV